jgi:hypothetical protein
MAGLVEAAADRPADAAGPIDDESHVAKTLIPAAKVRRRLLRCAMLTRGNQARVNAAG